VDLALYNTERYRPHYHHERGLPIFLSRCTPERSLARGEP
jgi:hypothetical protein